jgi:hypothetical protein
MKLIIILLFAFDVWKIPSQNGKPVSMPEGKFVAIHSDSAYFYFFTDKKEHEEFMDKLPKVPQGVIEPTFEEKIDSLFKEMSKVKLQTDSLKKEVEKTKTVK